MTTNTSHNTIRSLDEYYDALARGDEEASMRATGAWDTFIRCLCIDVLERNMPAGVFRVHLENFDVENSSVETLRAFAHLVIDIKKNPRRSRSHEGLECKLICCIADDVLNGLSSDVLSVDWTAYNEAERTD